MGLVKGQKYSRQQISELLGGSVQWYLPMKDGKVTCGCFRVEPRYNPGAPEEVIFGKGNIVESTAKAMSKQ